MYSLFKRTSGYSFSNLWIGATIGMIAAALCIYFSYVFDLIQNNVDLSDVFVYFLIGSVSISFLSASFVFIWRMSAALPIAYLWSLIFFVFTTYYFFIDSETTTGLIILGLWIVISFSLVGGALGVLFDAKNRKKIIPYIALITGLIGIFLLGLFLWNSTATAIENFHFILKNKPNRAQLSVLNPSKMGSFVVNKISYGPEIRYHKKNVVDPVFRTIPVDGSGFVGGWSGIDGWLRTRYWGFNAKQLPLSGIVWYPEGDGPFPLVMIVHGNHEMSASSENGYDYLGALWASRGFIAVSVDENFLNGSWIDLFSSLNETPARGWLLLEHLALWRKWNGQENHPFYHKVDLEHIALIGHSRGGEAIATAAALNRLKYFPDNGNIQFDYNFNISALAAIAPVDAQYTPGGIKIELNDIDYFVMQGSHDADVRAFQGAAQYSRIAFSGADYHYKSALYILGANHGQFNTLWGNNDTGQPTINLIDVSQLISETDQQEIAKVYLTAFLEASLHGSQEYLPLFHHYEFGLEWLPRTFYINEFADSTFRYVESKKKDIDIATTTLKGGHIQGENLDTWNQSRIVLKDGTPLNPETYIGWNEQNKNPSYIISLPESLSGDFHLLPSDSLVLSIANATNTSQEVDFIDFTIELKDRDHAVGSLLLSAYTPLHPVIRANVMKSSYLDLLGSTEPVFQTFEFSLSEFVKNNPLLDITKLESINLLFNQSEEGLIILNDVAFSSSPPQYPKEAL